jgi:hypothetical protein
MNTAALALVTSNHILRPSRLRLRAGAHLFCDTAARTPMTSKIRLRPSRPRQIASDLLVSGARTHSSHTAARPLMTSKSVLRPSRLRLVDADLLIARARAPLFEAMS